jgi:hypothetical protein
MATLQFFHGGNLDRVEHEMSYKKDRTEYGAGLYMITHYDTAAKYAKGSRKLYVVTINEGNDINDAFLPVDAVKWFINAYVSKPKRNDVFQRLEKHTNEMGVKAYIFDNILNSDKLIQVSKLDELRKFYVHNKIDYNIIKNPFGWGSNETMVVLYNTYKIVDVKRLDPKEKIPVLI